MNEDLGEKRAASLSQAAEVVQRFAGGSLTDALGAIERQLRGMSAQQFSEIFAALGISRALWAAGIVLKEAAGQVNVLLHAAGILLALPRILEQREVVIGLSLGAGNTGRDFDLETDRRIAEFSFIDWKGGPESIRQNAIFDDFFRLAEADTIKDRYLYVKGTHHPMRFFQGGRDLGSVMSRKESLQKRFRSLYGDRFATVREYYAHRRDLVRVVDLLGVVPEVAK